MFTFFFNLIVSLMLGQWRELDIPQIGDRIYHIVDGLGILITSTFNNVSEPMQDLGSYFTSMDIIYVVSFVVAMAITIGVVVAVVNIIKRIFTVFFYGVR